MLNPVVAPSASIIVMVVMACSQRLGPGVAGQLAVLSGVIPSILVVISFLYSGNRLFVCLVRCLGLSM